MLFQIQKYFSNWLKGNKTVFTFDPQDITYGRDLNEWQVGIGISIDGSRLPGEIDNLKNINATTAKQLAEIWESWKGDKSSFEEKAKQEVLGLGKGKIRMMHDFIERKNVAIQKMATDSSYQLDIDDILPPPAIELMEALMNTARASGIVEENLFLTILKYLSDANALLEVPCLKISSVMFAGLARSASLGEKKPPKSTVDVQFISSYLPYCDAMFVDKQSARMIRELPSSAPEHLRLNHYKAKIFTLNERDDFLQYLEDVVNQLSAEQIEALRDVEGDDFTKPFWSIIEQEKLNIKRDKI